MGQSTKLPSADHRHGITRKYCPVVIFSHDIPSIRTIIAIPFQVLDAFWLIGRYHLGL